MPRGTTFVIGSVAAAAAGAVAVGARRMMRSFAGDGSTGFGATSDGERWLTATVNREPDVVAGALGDVSDGTLAPGSASGAHGATRLDGGVDVRLRSAPGGRGTEVAVRPAGNAGRAAERRVRAALREAKQRLETGDVLTVAGQPEGQRRPGGLPLRFATRHAREEGVL